MNFLSPYHHPMQPGHHHHITFFSKRVLSSIASKHDRYTLLLLGQPSITIRNSNTQFLSLLYNLQTFLCANRRSYRKSLSQTIPQKVAEGTEDMFKRVGQEGRGYQFLRRRCGCTLKACRRRGRCGRGILYGLRVASVWSSCCFRSQSKM